MIGFYIRKIIAAIVVLFLFIAIVSILFACLVFPAALALIYSIWYLLLYFISIPTVLYIMLLLQNFKRDCEEKE